MLDLLIDHFQISKRINDPHFGNNDYNKTLPEHSSFFLFFDNILPRHMCNHLLKVTQKYSKETIIDVLERTESHHLVSVLGAFPDCQDIAIEILSKRLRKQRLHVILEQEGSRRTLEFDFKEIQDLQYTKFESKDHSLPILLQMNTTKPKVIAIQMEYEQTNLLSRTVNLDIRDVDVKSISQGSSWQLVYEVDSELASSKDRTILPRSFECQLDLLFSYSRENVTWPNKIKSWFNKCNWETELLAQYEQTQKQFTECPLRDDKKVLTSM
ncbi:hypothetical protein K7432_008086 [Basidiobolus ranarum]|uniref:Uncharacterized protein n=1 Tax=Basidiobolus ranarum TaxID=34480 RepID=A0ABR2VZ51_9FUNG